jgi:hypothetical protein
MQRRRLLQQTFVLALTGVVMAATGCASAHSALVATKTESFAGSNGFAGNSDATPIADRPCDSCAPVPVDSAIVRAVEKRVAELKARGGSCSSYGTVLESSLKSRQIMIRPFMWRVGSQLTSGEAKPNGEIVLAREIDSLNVGVRTLDDLLRSMEHEAAHIAFRIGNDIVQDHADDYVRACRS